MNDSLLDLKAIITWVINIGGFGTILYLGRAKLENMEEKLTKLEAKLIRDATAHHECRVEVIERLARLETWRNGLKESRFSNSGG